MDTVVLPVDVAVGRDAASDARGASDVRMKLRYGFNETVGWRQFALGTDRERIWDRLRDVDTRIIRIFTFTEYTPDPDVDWAGFAAYVQAVLNVSAVPMITFVTLPRLGDGPGAISAFSARCVAVAARCIERWGGALVRDWAWAIGNKPNSAWTNGGLTFDGYRPIYEEVAQGLVRQLQPFLDGCRPMIGGAGVDTFQPFWTDWIWRFVHEIDNALIGFVSWNRYGDWREPGTWGAPPAARVFDPLLMSRTSEYGRCTQSVARAIEGRGILNICTELNAHAHHESRVSARFNRTMFGAAYYACALIQLMRAGADAELLWTGTSDEGPFGAIDSQGRPTPVYTAKRLCTDHIRYGDRLVFPGCDGFGGGLQVVVASGHDGGCSCLLAHVRDEVATYELADTFDLPDGSMLLKIDGHGTSVTQGPFDGSVTFRGYGVAAVTNRGHEKGVR